MATSILSVITEYCSIYVDDLNMSELAATDPPLFARNAWQLLKPALAKFTHPPEMQDYLRYDEPSYDSTTYTTPTELLPTPFAQVVFDDSIEITHESQTYTITVPADVSVSDFNSWIITINGKTATHTTIGGAPAASITMYGEDVVLGSAYVAVSGSNLLFKTSSAWASSQPVVGTYTVTVATGTPIIISLGDEYKGYDLCTVRARFYDRVGNLVLVPIASRYDAETGDIMIAPAEDIPENTVFEIDFYKDGQFINTLSPQMCDIIGLCFQYVWQDRFNTDWLSIVSKIEDKSFQEQNRANKMNADGMRLREIAIKLYDAMRKFEQDVYYKSRFPGGTGVHI